MIAPNLNLLVLRFADIARAESLYRELGFQFKRHAHGAGPEHYSAEVNGFVFELYPITPKSSPTTGARIGFKVGSLDEVVAALIKVGAVIVTAATDSKWGRRAVIRDLEGHTIELVATKDLPNN